MRALRNSNANSSPPVASWLMTVGAYFWPMVVFCFVGSGRPGRLRFMVCFMSSSCTTRSPIVHFNFSSTGPVGGVNVDDEFNLPDLLQPDPAQTSAVTTMNERVFVFINSVKDFLR